MRTLSARILLGFIALTLTLGVFAATIVVNLREVEDEASLILRGYVPLAMVSADLLHRQEDLKNYLDSGIGDAARPGEITRTLTTLRGYRDRALGEIVKTLEGLGSLTNTDGQASSELSKQLPKTTPMVDDLKHAMVDVGPLYDRLDAKVLAAPPKAPNKSDPGFQAAYDALDPQHKAAYDALQRLREAELGISRKVVDLKNAQSIHTTQTKDWLANNERTIMMRAIYFGLAAVVLGVLITAWVAVTLRPLRRLREGARRIAAGDYGKRISETGPTEIADLAREFNSMGRAVQEREEEKLRAARLAMVGKMAAQIAHEVRNPLSSIGLNTELLEDELGDNATEARELCRAIHTEVNRLTEVTETYLGLRGGKPKLARESLNAIIGDLVGFVRSDLATRHVELDTDLDPADPPSHVDANQIRQCLINLVRNAADAVAAKGSGRVTLRTRGGDRRIEIAVEDNGVGIPSELIPRLFDPFFTTKERGNGLGLALTQQIIRDHGGDIQVNSRVGRGTTFTLSIPAG
ncbi:MAG TPA: ATP-binding protein [Kofleriaceae bacterium]|jgi:signal transduction histidine kinase|nr:ATP-binding protein [Kofleriaceae bacterium]